MSCIGWNCRGLGNPRKVLALKKEIKSKVPMFVFLCETKLLLTELIVVSRKLGFDRCSGVDCILTGGGRRGGIGLLWRHDCNIQILSSSLNHIDALIGEEEGEIGWRFTGVYGWPEAHLKWKTWDMLEALTREMDRPWICLGDFNEILYDYEKRGGRPRAAQAMQDFRDVLDRCRLTDLGFEGNKFTWTNGQAGENNIQERLDRAVANGEWITKFLDFRITHLTRLLSDHCPVSISWIKRHQSSRGGKTVKLFRFEAMWLQDPHCKNIVNENWNEGDHNIVRRTVDNIQRCGESLSRWDKECFGDIPREIERGKKNLECIHSLPATQDNIAAARTLENKLAALMRKEEAFWHQRSRVNWMRDGDKNTSFFHKTANGRKRRNHIDIIMDNEGRRHEEEKDICNVFQDYFHTLFSAKDSLDMDEAIEAVNHRITDELHDLLSQPFTEEEVVQAISQMHPTKAPGPDGMSAIFFQKFWKIVGTDVIHSTLDVLNNGTSPQPFNHTHIVLIPKIKNPLRSTNFRPISLCNVSLKIITKTIANRIKICLPSAIDTCQFAFVLGRLITDNALLAFEIFHHMKHNKAISK